MDSPKWEWEYFWCCQLLIFVFRPIPRKVPFLCYSLWRKDSTGIALFLLWTSSLRPEFVDAHCRALLLIALFFLRQSPLWLFRSWFSFIVIRRSSSLHWQWRSWSSRTAVQSFCSLDPRPPWFLPLGQIVFAPTGCVAAQLSLSFLALAWEFWDSAVKFVSFGVSPVLSGSPFLAVWSV